ncbi:DNA-binding protein [Pectobacterium carotovorum]|uniref:TIR domain-containing protein n=1 Tax=Pectobacterium carotovorum TaxID=554 RepID=UPI000E7282BF|nr:nucleotide-binding protein [Pectobacterium carotovorum]RJL48663.1 DNA-binding protein [Pectobacterium carotovorum]
MYYHVIVETIDKNAKGNYERCYELDCKDLDEIVDLIVRPYSKSEQIYINGMYLDWKKVRLLKIKSSEKPLAELQDIAQSKVSPGVFFVHTAISVVNSDKYVTDITKDTLKSVGEILKSTIATATPVSTDKNKVFIVHGRDEHAKTEAARFVERLGFSAVILHEQASSGKTIIEKIESHTNVGFAIVLYTPCDVGCINGEDFPKPRARQNVVFEHGYLIGKLGRHNVCALVKGDVEIPNDISGVVYVTFDSDGAWHFKVAKEMRNSGYTVDMNKVI